MLPSHHHSCFVPRSRFQLIGTACLLVTASLLGAGCSSDAGSEPDDSSAGKGGGSSAGAGGSSAGSAGKGNSAGASGAAQAGGGSGGANGGTGGASAGASGASGGSGGGASGSGGGSGDGKAFVEACLDSVTKLPTTSQVERIRLSGTGVDVGVMRYIGDGAGLAVPWEALALALSRGTQQACVTKNLKYTLSRHNFNDLLSAPASADSNWVWNQQASEGFVNYKFTIAEKKGTTAVWGPLALKIESCRELIGKKNCDYSK